SPKWMNIPKRASCHHCMRRARSASCALLGFCGKLVSAPEKIGAAPAEAPSASEAPVPASQSRRGMRLDLMRTPPVFAITNQHCPLRQSAIEMHVAAIHHNVLPGDVAGLRPNKKQKHGGDFLRGGHPVPQRNLRDNLFPLLLGIRK